MLLKEIFYIFYIFTDILLKGISHWNVANLCENLCKSIVYGNMTELTHYKNW